MTWNGTIIYKHRCDDCGAIKEESLEIHHSSATSSFNRPHIPANWAEVKINDVTHVYCDQCIQRGIKFKFQRPVYLESPGPRYV